MLSTNGMAYRLITDQLGSGRAVASLSGQVMQRIEYDAWGDVTTGTAPDFQSLGYAGGLMDRATGRSPKWARSNWLAPRGR